MKRRTKWFQLSPHTPPIKHLVEAMQERQYSRSRAAGFQLGEVRHDHVDGLFVERVEWDDMIDDPARGELIVHRIEVRQVRFRLTSVAPELEVIDSPHSLQNFVDSLSDCAGTVLRLQELSISPLEWLSEVEKRLGRTVVTFLCVSGLTISPSTYASLAFNGNEDVRPYLKRFAGSDKANVDRLIAALCIPNQGAIELLAGGKAILQNVDDLCVQTIRDALVQVAKLSSKV